MFKYLLHFCFLVASWFADIVCLSIWASFGEPFTCAAATVKDGPGKLGDVSAPKDAVLTWFWVLFGLARWFLALSLFLNLLPVELLACLLTCSPLGSNVSSSQRTTTSFSWEGMIFWLNILRTAGAGKALSSSWICWPWIKKVSFFGPDQKIR